MPTLPWELFTPSTTQFVPSTSRVQFVQIVRAQTHFYCAFRYGDQDGCSPLWRSVALRCSGQSADAHPHSPPFYCPQCVTSLLVSSNSLCPLCVLSVPPLSPIGPAPLFSTPHADPVLSTANPTQRVANPNSGPTLYQGPMTIQTMKGWNSFSC